MLLFAFRWRIVDACWISWRVIWFEFGDGTGMHHAISSLPSRSSVPHPQSLEHIWRSARTLWFDFSQTRNRYLPVVVCPVGLPERNVSTSKLGACELSSITRADKRSLQRSSHQKFWMWTRRCGGECKALCNQFECACRQGPAACVRYDFSASKSVGSWSDQSNVDFVTAGWLPGQRSMFPYIDQHNIVAVASVLSIGWPFIFVTVCSYGIVSLQCMMLVNAHTGIYFAYSGSCPHTRSRTVPSIAVALSPADLSLSLSLCRLLYPRTIPNVYTQHHASQSQPLTGSWEDSVLEWMFLLSSDLVSALHYLCQPTIYFCSGYRFIYLIIILWHFTSTRGSVTIYVYLWTRAQRIIADMGNEKHAEKIPSLYWSGMFS